MFRVRVRVGIRAISIPAPRARPWFAAVLVAFVIVGSTVTTGSMGLLQISSRAYLIPVIIAGLIFAAGIGTSTLVVSATSSRKRMQCLLGIGAMLVPKVGARFSFTALAFAIMFVLASLGGGCEKVARIASLAPGRTVTRNRFAARMVTLCVSITTITSW